jgi:sensor histidine kinase YesM
MKCLSDYLWQTLVPLIFFSFIWMLYRFIDEQEEVEKVKKEHTEMELKFLKSQINPHFLFNTLNNLFGIARKIDAMPVADGISKLSHLMRYMLYDSEVDLVTLEKEVNYLNNYIDLQKLRIESLNNIHLNIKLNNYNPELKIAPLILIPFVENAFKHGISIKEKSEIEIELKTNEKIIAFSVTNTINKLRKNRDDESSGFGLKNVHKRLNLLYPDRYSLNINDDNDKYCISLSINTQA